MEKEARVIYLSKLPVAWQGRLVHSPAIVYTQRLEICEGPHIVIGIETRPALVTISGLRLQKVVYKQALLPNL